MKAQTCWERVKTAASEAEKPRNIQQKFGAAVRLSQESSPRMKTRSRRMQLHAWMATAQQCKGKTQPMWNTLHMEQSETWSSSIAQWCSRSYRDCHAVTEYHTVVWKTSADHAVAELSRPDREEAYRYFSRAREGDAACERDTGNKNHTVVLEVVPRTTTTHSGVEGLSGPCRGRVPKTEDRRQSSLSVQLVVVNYPTVEYESIFREPTITQ